MASQNANSAISMYLTVRPSIAEYFRTMRTRFETNRATMVALIAAIGGALASMTIMSRGSITAPAVLPAMIGMGILMMAPSIGYALFVRIRVDCEDNVERRSPWGLRRLHLQHVDIVRYSVRYAAALSGKRFYIAIDDRGRGQFTLRASMWPEGEIRKLAAAMNGVVRGSWDNVIDVTFVNETFGSAMQQW